MLTLEAAEGAGSICMPSRRRAHGTTSVDPEHPALAGAKSLTPDREGMGTAGTEINFPGTFGIKSAGRDLLKQQGSGNDPGDMRPSQAACKESGLIAIMFLSEVVLGNGFLHRTVRLMVAKAEENAMIWVSPHNSTIKHNGMLLDRPLQMPRLSGGNLASTRKALDSSAETRMNGDIVDPEASFAPPRGASPNDIIVG